MTLSPDLLKRLPHWLLGGGAGCALTILLVLAEKEPGAIVGTLRQWGPASLIGMIAVALASRAFDQVVDVGRQIVASSAQTAQSQQSLADAVNRIANKDDREREEQRRLLSYIGTQQEKILERLDALKLEEKAKGAHG
jgi:hypothetical protein